MRVLLILLFPILLFAQRTNNLITNGDFEIGNPPSNFTYSSGTAAASSDVPTNGGSQSLQYTANADNALAWQSFNISEYAGKTAVVSWSVKSADVGYRARIRFKDIQSGINNYYPAYAEYPTWTTLNASFTFNISATTMEVHHYCELTGNVCLFDNTILRAELDTLWIDETMPDESDNDTTRTLGEAFEVRGAHSGGNFIINAGTYNESITIDSDFAKLEASGTATVTSIDFNNVTATVDLANLTINTKLNDANITYLNVPSHGKGFGKWDISDGWGGY